MVKREVDLVSHFVGGGADHDAHGALEFKVEGGDELVVHVAGGLGSITFGWEESLSCLPLIA